MKYILDAHQPIPCPDLLTWMEWFEEAENRIVGSDRVNGILVSTVFLGYDHSFGRGEPILFETMLLTDVEADIAVLPFQSRYTTWEAAEAGHQMAIEYLRVSLPAT